MKDILFVVRLCLFYIFFFLFSDNAIAYVNFIDNFDYLNNQRWTVNANNGTVLANNSELQLSSQPSFDYPYVIISNNNFPSGEYIADIRVKLSGSINYGAGIAFSSEPPPFPIHRDLSRDDVMFQIWPESQTKVGVWSTICTTNTSCSPQYYDNQGSFDFDSWTDIRIIRTDDSKYKFILNDQELFTTLETSEQIKYIWFGNPQTTNTLVQMPNISIDYFRISSNTPIIDSNPIVILPGLGASWDFGALITGSDGGNWQIPSFIGVYNGLISSIENAGLSQSEPNKKLYIFGYDWRKPLDHVADKLKNYLDSNIPSGTKVDLVGHSMGGLVARSYIQKYGIDRIDQVLTIGSPHYGSAKAYSVWEGGTVLDGSWWNKLALELTVHFGALDGEEKVDTVRRLSPSIKDLLPTYDYLAKDGLVVPELLMNHRNLYLHTLNDNFHGFDEVLTPFYSKSIEDTGYRISVYDPSDLELSRGLWVDGKPQDSDPYFYANGDGTVVDFSAKGPFSNNIELNGRHDEIVTAKNNIDRVLSFLNLDSSNSVAGVDDSRNRVFVAALKSPGKLSVCDKDTQLCDADLGVVVSDKLIFIPGFMGQQLKVSVSEDGLGEYALHLGNIDWKSEWVVINDALNREGENDIFEVSSDDNGEMSVYQQDNTPPSTPQITNLNNPSIACGGATKSDSVDVSWGESSDASGIKEYQLEIRYFENEIEKINNISTPDRFANAYIFEGKNYLKVRAVDNASNSSSWSDECLVTVDYAAPYIAISSPLNKTYSITTPPKLEYTVIDNADPSPEIVVSGWSTLVGNHTVVVTATDDVGNISSASVAYSIASNNNVPQICQGNNWRVFWMFGVRNQSQCVTFVNKYQKQITYILYLLRRHF